VALLPCFSDKNYRSTSRASRTDAVLVAPICNNKKTTMNLRGRGHCIAHLDSACMVNRELCSLNTTKGSWQSIRSQESVLMDTAPAGSGPGAWLRNSGKLPGALKHLCCSKTLHTPGSQNLFDTVESLVRSLCRGDYYDQTLSRLGCLRPKKGTPNRCVR
jgi:hypothetical protein